LDPQIVVNLLPKLGVGVDLVMHEHWLGKDSPVALAGLFDLPRR
jgi:hypothetical protein